MNISIGPAFASEKKYAFFEPLCALFHKMADKLASKNKNRCRINPAPMKITQKRPAAIIGPRYDGDNSW